MKLALLALLSTCASALTRPRSLAGPQKSAYAALAVRGGGLSKQDYVKAVGAVFSLRAAASSSSSSSSSGRARP